MDFIEWQSRPELQNPAAIIAFEGWGDASSAASGATEILLERAEGPFATLDPEEFFNYQMQRPVVWIDHGGSREIQWPGAELYAVRVPGRDLVLVVGEEPHLRWRVYCRSIIEALRACDVEIVITLGAFIGRVAHTLPVPIFGVATDPDDIARYGLLVSDYEGPTGIVGTLHNELHRANIPSISLWAAVPHYLAANHNPKVSLALLTKAAEILRLPLDLADLTDQAEAFKKRVDEAMRQSEELIAYVAQLESDTEQPDMNPEAATQLISEIEQFLKEA